jgi:hypothetical protein
MDKTIGIKKTKTPKSISIEKWIEEIEASITPEEIEREKEATEYFIEKTKRRTMSYLDEHLFLLNKYGYKPLIYTTMMLEDTFVFSTKKEALKAYKQFEKNPLVKGECISGWWYGLKDFLKEKEEYELEKNYKLQLTYLF